MKKLIVILALLLMGVSTFAQKQNKAFTDDQIQGDTTVYVSNMKVDQYANHVVIFTFTHTDVADSLAVAKIQASNDNTTFFDITGTGTSLSLTTTDGTSRLYVTNPLDLYYRGFLSCAAGDTVSITNARIIIKEDK